MMGGGWETMCCVPTVACPAAPPPPLHLGRNSPTHLHAPPLCGTNRPPVPPHLRDLVVGDELVGLCDTVHDPPATQARAIAVQGHAAPARGREERGMTGKQTAPRQLEGM